MASGSLKVIRARHSYGDIPTYGPPLKITRLPRTEDELWHWYRTVLGVQFPRKQCCADHIAPFQLVCDVYFRRFPTVLVTGSRGFSGKSYTLAAMAIGEAILHGVPVNVLGGSASQSLNVHEISQQVWWQNYAPRHLLARDPSRFETTLTNGGRIRALLASSRSVRGPHPNVLCLDEADEMEIDIVDAALGQPMPQVSGTTGQRIPAITVIISTHHYPHGTMTEMLERAKEQGFPSYKWCYRETELTADNPTGWLETATIEQKRREVTSRMWQIEYDLGDPAVKDTLIDPMSVERMWDIEEGFYEGKPGEEIFIERPRPVVEYAHGVVWAKKRDWTVHMVWRPTDDGWRLVYFCRQNRKPWPEMVSQVMEVLRKYPGTMCHDATGVGDVISDLFPEEARQHRFIQDIIMRGEARSQMFSDYVRAIEGGVFKAPRIKWAYEEHLYLQYESLYSSSGHPPDSVVAGSMAWLGRGSAFNIEIDPSMMGLGNTVTNTDWAMAPRGAGALGWDPWDAVGAGVSGGWNL